MTKRPTIIVASHGDEQDAGTLSDLVNGFGNGGVQRFHADGLVQTLKPSEIRTCINSNTFVLLGLSKQSLVAGTRVQMAERNILLGAHTAGACYGIYCRYIRYALSQHLYDAVGMRLLVTREQPSTNDLMQLKRAYTNLGAPVIVHVPQHDAKRVLERMHLAFEPSEV